MKYGKMGCGASSQLSRDYETKTTFPLSMYQKELLQETWKELEKSIVTLGNGSFYR